MTHAAGCLDDLSAGQRRVLTLRAGIGAGPPRSRGSVARRLGIAVRRVARLERTGLKRLRALDSAGRCAPPPITAVDNVVASTAGDDVVASTVGATRRSGSRDAPRERARTPSGVRPSGGGVAGVSEINQPADGGLSLLIPAVLLALVLAAVLAARMRRGQAAPAPQATTGPSWDEPPPPSHEDSWARSPDR